MYFMANQGGYSKEIVFNHFTGASHSTFGNSPHKGHCEELQYMWWPGLDKAIETQVKNFKSCQIVNNSPPKAPLNLWVWPMHPWERIHVNFAGLFLNRMFMIVVDAH